MYGMVLVVERGKVLSRLNQMEIEMMITYKVTQYGVTLYSGTMSQCRSYVKSLRREAFAEGYSCGGVEISEFVNLAEA